MKKAKILFTLRDGRDTFLEAIQGISEDELEKPGVIDDWSVKDIMIHLTRWEAELVKLLWQAKQGVKPTTIHFDPSSVDEINARWFKDSQSRPFKIARDDFLGVRKQTIRRVEALSNEELTDPQYYPWQSGQPLWKWIANDSFEHEAEHEAQIRDWLKNMD
jgi:hypothetical protein